MSLWLLLRGMGIEAVGIGGATIAHTAGGLLGALTLMPSGLGSTEAGTVGRWLSRAWAWQQPPQRRC